MRSITDRFHKFRPLLFLLILTCGSQVEAGEIFVGVDLTSDSDCGKMLQEAYAKKKGVTSKHIGPTTKPADLCKSLTDLLKKEIDPKTGKLKCEKGSFTLYVSSHGACTDDEKDSLLVNPDFPQDSLKLSDLARCVAALIPECCVLVFAMDACGTECWYKNYIEPQANGDPNPNNPFNNVNYMVAHPYAPDGICYQSPVCSALKSSFDKRRTLPEFADYLGKQRGVQTIWSADEEHQGYLFPASVPEPSTLVLSAFALSFGGCAAIRRRRVA